ncbi:MAG: hypothetical protein WCZ90_02460 [Melioribacteraceae bacterium]
MKRLSEYIDANLKIVKKSFFGFEYDLVAGEEVLGSIKYNLFFGTREIVKGLEKRNVEFYKTHFLSRQINIREEGKEIPFAKYNREMISRTGNIYLPNGYKLFIHFGFFDFTTEIRDEKGNAILLLKRQGAFSRTLSVIIKRKSEQLDENPWIIFLALYLIIKRRKRRR